MRRRISSVPTRLPGSEFKNQTVRSIDPNAALVLHTKSYAGTRGEYQSRIRDLYDNSIVTYKTAASQTVYIVLDTIHLAICWKRRRSPESCSSTATKAFNTPLKHTPS